MATYDKLIQVKNLKKYYNGDKIKALDGVSVDINKGDVMVIIGPSGGGKSTFLRSLNLLEKPTEGSIIFEPGPALAKSGAFNLIASRIGATQLDRSTHLYLNPGEEPPRQFGKIWQVIEVLPFGGKSLKDISRRYSDAEVSARGIPMTSEEMRRKMGLKSGGGVHIFGVGVSPEIKAEGLGNAKGRMLLLVCRRV